MRNDTPRNATIQGLCLHNISTITAINKVCPYFQAKNVSTTKKRQTLVRKVGDCLSQTLCRPTCLCNTLHWPRGHVSILYHQVSVVARERAHSSSIKTQFQASRPTLSSNLISHTEPAPFVLCTIRARSLQTNVSRYYCLRTS